MPISNIGWNPVKIEKKTVTFYPQTKYTKGQGPLLSQKSTSSKSTKTTSKSTKTTSKSTSSKSTKTTSKSTNKNTKGGATNSRSNKSGGSSKKDKNTTTSKFALTIDELGKIDELETEQNLRIAEDDKKRFERQENALKQKFSDTTRLAKNIFATADIQNPKNSYYLPQKEASFVENVIKDLSDDLYKGGYILSNNVTSDEYTYSALSEYSNQKQYASDELSIEANYGSIQRGDKSNDKSGVKSGVQANEYILPNLALYLPNWGYKDFINERINWQKQLVPTFSEPAYCYFKLFFHFNTSQGLFGGILQDESGRQFPSENSAATFLKMWAGHYLHENVGARLANLVYFVRLLNYTANYRPWMFTNVNGVDKLLVDDLTHPLENNKITLTMAPDTVDFTTQSMMNLYKNAVFDMVNYKEVVPINLRKFDMSIIAFETPIRYVNTHAKIQGSEYPYQQIFGTDEDERMTFKMYTFKGCEFQLSSLKSQGTFSNAGPFQMNGTTLEIKFDKVFEHVCNNFWGFNTGDLGWVNTTPPKNVQFNDRIKRLGEYLQNPPQNLASNPQIVDESEAICQDLYNYVTNNAINNYTTQLTEMDEPLGNIYPNTYTSISNIISKNDSEFGSNVERSFVGFIPTEYTYTAKNSTRQPMAGEGIEYKTYSGGLTLTGGANTIYGQTSGLYQFNSRNTDFWTQIRFGQKTSQYQALSYATRANLNTIRVRNGSISTTMDFDNTKYLHGYSTKEPLTPKGNLNSVMNFDRSKYQHGHSTNEPLTSKGNLNSVMNFDRSKYQHGHSTNAPLTPKGTLYNFNVKTI